MRRICLPGQVLVTRTSRASGARLTTRTRRRSRRWRPFASGPAARFAGSARRTRPPRGAPPLPGHTRPAPGRAMRRALRPGDRAESAAHVARAAPASRADRRGRRRPRRAARDVARPRPAPDATERRAPRIGLAARPAFGAGERIATRPPTLVPRCRSFIEGVRLAGLARECVADGGRGGAADHHQQRRHREAHATRAPVRRLRRRQRPPGGQHRPRPQQRARTDQVRRRSDLPAALDQRPHLAPLHSFLAHRRAPSTLYCRDVGEVVLESASSARPRAGRERGPKLGQLRRQFGGVVGPYAQKDSVRRWRIPAPGRRTGRARSPTRHRRRPPA